MAARDDRGDRGGRRPRGDGGDTGAPEVDPNNIVNDALTSIGDLAAEGAVTNFKKYVTARLWKAGIRNSTAFTFAVIAIKTLIGNTALPPEVKALLVGAAAGTEDGFRYEFRRLTEIERDWGREAVNVEVNQNIDRKGAPLSHTGSGHAPAPAAGAAHHEPKAATIAAAEYTGFYQMLAAHPQRAALQAVFTKIQGTRPDIFDLIVEMESAPNFLKELAELAIGLGESPMIAAAIERLVVKTIDAKRKKIAEGAVTIEDKVETALRNGFGRVNKAFERGLDALGVPKRPELHGRPGDGRVHDAVIIEEPTHVAKSRPGSFADAYRAFDDDEGHGH